MISKTFNKPYIGIEMVGHSLEVIDAHKAYNLARTEYYQAMRNFDNADPEFVDMAIKALKLSEEKVDLCLARVRALQNDRSNRRYSNYSNEDLLKAKKESQYGGTEAYFIHLEIERRKEEEVYG